MEIGLIYAGKATVRFTYVDNTRFARSSMRTRLNANRTLTFRGDARLFTFDRTSRETNNRQIRNEKLKLIKRNIKYTRVHRTLEQTPCSCSPAPRPSGGDGDDIFKIRRTRIYAAPRGSTNDADRSVLTRNDARNVVHTIQTLSVSVDHTRKYDFPLMIGR